MEEQQPFHIRFLREELQRRKERNPAYSLRAFARTLSMDPSDLSKFLSGRKQLTLKGTARLIKIEFFDLFQIQRLRSRGERHTLAGSTIRSVSAQTKASSRSGLPDP